MAAPRWDWSQGREFFRSMPVTKAIIVAWVIVFAAGFLRVPLASLLGFAPNQPLQAITGLLTYPLAVGPDPIGLLLNGLMLWWFGGSLERSWGSRTCILFLVGVNLAALLALEAGFLLFTRGLVPLATPWLMISSVIVAWAWTNPEQTILFWFVLPLKAKWVGWIDIAVLYSFAPHPEGIGWLHVVSRLFALGGVAAALGYVWHRRRFGWIPRRPRPSPRALRHPAASPWRRLLRPFEEWQRRRRVERLRRTFKVDDERPEE